MEEFYINVSDANGVLFSTRSVPSYRAVMTTYEFLSAKFPAAGGYTVCVYKQPPKPFAERIATTGK